MTKLAGACVLIFFIATLVAVSAEEAHSFIAIDAPIPEDKDFKEADIKAHHPPANHHRRRRAATCGTQTKLHPVQVKESVMCHNHFRGNEKATNMHTMIWSDELGAVAQAWADQCKWEHGMLYDCSGDRMGQNLFIEASSMGYPALNVTAVCASWAGERKDWNFETGQCATGKVCGHWSQLVAAETLEVGCAVAQCATITVGGALWKNALLVVCDYFKPGNHQGEAVFEAGTPCTNCDKDRTGAGYRCNNNLCEKCSPATDSTCKCGKALLCEHGGTWSASTCTCTCTKGYYGVGCEHTCTCADLTPNECAHWIDYCPYNEYSDFMGENCKTTCQFPCSLPASCTA